jgi:NAD(P)-dependent dehydrogenase (short-subunit alcohol dehydrogenase family)
MTTTARVALVTGASAGLGRACADKLASAGWDVTGASRRGTSSTGWPGLVMDVDEDASVAAGVAELITAHGHIDALVAAAGWGIAEAKAQFETNFWGCVRVVQAVLPHMRARRSGRIVLLSSLGGVIGIPFQAYYSASKFALEGWAESLAYEVAPFGVSVTLIQPGNFATDFTASRKMAAAAGRGDYAAATTNAAPAAGGQDRRAGRRLRQATATVPGLRGSGKRQPRRGLASPKRRVLALSCWYSVPRPRAS